ncbi:glycerophosphodiester phosphodiesterase family protein [Shewanella sp. Isolate11]|uniref:glycerophosphodiester phosphodiesterase n=1 Tax=Shewanella sp. Isolate11 TaxID=2908530 RepID=UPI001EFD661E|nr:glycerophosphodiester phosphodiesterase family protein [Shewanella sp. Isolate11]MCG9697494.1 glycerophosphodiester phosphodiesterase [Shewanella sp. Isolate11]
MQVFAHRGASGYAPENTLAAMKKAIALGITAIELDVHNVEGELYVFHDRRLDGKSSGVGLIESVSQAYLSTINVEGEPIPKLWELLVYLKPYQPVVNIELKGMASLAAFIELYPKVLSQLDYKPQQLIISSFNHGFIREVKQQFPQALVAPLIEGIPDDGAALASRLRAYSLHLSLSFLTQEIIDDAHQRGIKVFVYTVDNPQDIAMLAAMGVDGIFSNYPDKSLQQIKQISQL